VHPRRHQLTRGVGVEDTISIDVTSIHAIAGDRILLCSDGLSNELDPDTLARLASAPTGLEFAVESLVSAAKTAGGHDNISVILLEFDEVNVTEAPIHRTMSSAPPPVETTRPKNAGRRRRIVTWRVWVATFLFLAVVAGGIAVVHWYAYSTYYLGDDGGTIAVYQGQPSGVLWYQPLVVRNTDYSASQLRPGDAQALASSISEPTIPAALRYANYLHNEWKLAHSDTSATTTTTQPHTTTTASG
jgi:protein phosphatase